MAFKATGRLIKKFDTVQVSDKFRKREFVIEIADGKYPQTVVFQCTGDRCQLLDDIHEGMGVDVDFNLRGREWISPKGEVRYFNTLDVWTVKDVSSGNGQRSEPKREQPGQAGERDPYDPNEVPF